MRNRSYFNNQLKKDSVTKRPICEGKHVEEEPKLLLEISERQYQLNKIFNEFTVQDGIRWIYGYANYVNVLAKKPRSTNYHYRTYKEGTIVMLDFFGGFSTELIYDHPAIILKCSKDGLIVAPLTSNAKVYSNAVNVDTHIRLDRNIVPYGNLPKNSTIKLEQLRFVSKYRVLQSNGRVTDKPKLNEIQDALSGLLAEHVTKQRNLKIQGLEQDKAILEGEKTILEGEKTTLEIENASLKEELVINKSEKQELVTEILKLEKEKEQLVLELSELKVRTKR
ncbi:type II toxin-antitoxin system PemK/MazF family toxin [Lysinibacillus sp. UGB7]|uniref:type II toxin-antitoxin system PemK/MazF family toxin n=1 Tax=Lysinibacillus sp. UGB7 TaxID=3411039 RepID=UPI003B7DA5BF